MGYTNNRPPGKTVCVPRTLEMPHAKAFIAVLFTTVIYAKIGDQARAK